ncbi:hypothetical protein [Halosegnis longus]|uniref:hypothetical protein n=1 Tax=Halosegnis longus TaxID=2216012 RepID=UPI00096A8078|nr:hypothetical protein [Salella cibi]
MSADDVQDRRKQKARAGRKGGARRMPVGDERPTQCEVTPVGARQTFAPEAVWNRVLRPQACQYCFGKDATVEEAIAMATDAGAQLSTTTNSRHVHFVDPNPEPDAASESTTEPTATDGGRADVDRLTDVNGIGDATAAELLAIYDGDFEALVADCEQYQFSAGGPRSIANADGFGPDRAGKLGRRIADAFGDDENADIATDGGSIATCRDCEQCGATVPTVVLVDGLCVGCRQQMLDDHTQTDGPVRYDSVDECAATAACPNDPAGSHTRYCREHSYFRGDLPTDATTAGVANGD